MISGSWRTSCLRASHIRAVQRLDITGSAGNSRARYLSRSTNYIPSRPFHGNSNLFSRARSLCTNPQQLYRRTNTNSSHHGSAEASTWKPVYQPEELEQAAPTGSNGVCSSPDGSITHQPSAGLDSIALTASAEISESKRQSFSSRSFRRHRIKRDNNTQFKRPTLWRHIPLRQKVVFASNKSTLETRIWHHVAKSTRAWFKDMDYLYSIFSRDYPSSLKSVPNHLYKFERFLGPSNPFGDCSTTILYAWRRLSWRGKVIWWRHALYYSLLNSPEAAMNIIQDISSCQWMQVPGSIIADFLLLLDARFVVSNVYDDGNQHILRRFQKSACHYLDRYTKREGKAILPWPIVRRLSRSLDNLESLDALVRSITRSKSEYPIYTKLHTMRRYVKLNKLSKALDIFETFSDNEKSNRAVQAFCVTILRLPWQVDDIHEFRRHLTTWLVEKGMQPGCMLRNVILQNYLDSGARKSAWRMLETIVDRGLIVSDHTFSIFLNQTHLDDSAAISSLYEMAKKCRILQQYPFLGASFVHMAAQIRFAADENSFTALLSLFEDIFDTTDLEEFGIIESRQQNKESIKVRPPTFALQWMLRSWIYENRTDPERLTVAYNNYLFHIRNNHPRISLLASTDRIGMAFVLAFGERKSYLHMCTKVLQDMLSPPQTKSPEAIAREVARIEQDPNVPEHEKFLEPEEPDFTIPVSAPAMDQVSEPDYEMFLEPEVPKPNLPPAAPLVGELDLQQRVAASLQREAFGYKIAPPSVYTWNSLLSVLLKHGEHDSAESVLKAMQASGFLPTLVTWQILMRGFVGRPTPEILQNAQKEQQQNFLPDAETAAILAGASSESNLPNLGIKIGDVENSDQVLAEFEEEELLRRAENFLPWPELEESDMQDTRIVPAS